MWFAVTFVVAWEFSTSGKVLAEEDIVLVRADGADDVRRNLQKFRDRYVTEQCYIRHSEPSKLIYSDITRISKIERWDGRKELPPEDGDEIIYSRYKFENDEDLQNYIHSEKIKAYFQK